MSRGTIARHGLVATIVLALSAAADAQTSAADRATQVPGGASAATAARVMADGEVRKIDREQVKVTLRHGPIGNLEMPAMTMVFKVADAKMLDNLKEGDKVKFAADRIGGAITITAIEAAK